MTTEEIIKEEWLKIVDLVANAKGIVDLVTAEKLFQDRIQNLRQSTIQECVEVIDNIPTMDGGQKNWKNYLKQKLTNLLK